MQKYIFMKFTQHVFALITFISLALLCQQCKSSQSSNSTVNAPAQGFNAAESDAQAIKIADEVMLAMGGRKAWDETKVIAWQFFSGRMLTWDKQTGNVRVEWLKKPIKVIMNINDGTGKVALSDVEQTHPDSLKKYLKMGKDAWINDSYWLVMPYKLKDSGVTLKYIGVGNTEDGRNADILQLTFANVGVTPDNKYHVWVDKETRLVTQWAFFEKFTQEKPGFSNPWTGYQEYGKIKLSDGRGKGSLSKIQVMDAAPEGTFTKL